jgi:hypothetical protein
MNEGLNYSNLLNLSLLTVSWSRVLLEDNIILDKSAEQFKELLIDANEESSEEICKILWAYNSLSYRSELIVQGINEYLATNIDKMNINNIIDVFVSYSNLYPEELETNETLLTVISINFSQS